MAATETQEVRAEAKWVRTSARKARLVLEHIRGRTVPEARTVLAFSERAVAHDIEQVLRSAVANAEANHGLVGDELVVYTAYADEGPTLKRWRARARGRVARIRKRTCHITVTLVEAPAVAAPVVEEAAPAEVAEAPEPKRAAAKKTTASGSKKKSASKRPAKKKEAAK